MLPRLWEKGWKICVFLPAVGKQNATFSPDFTQWGKSLLEIPCICYKIIPSCLILKSQIGQLLCPQYMKMNIWRHNTQILSLSYQILSYFASSKSSFWFIFIFFNANLLKSPEGELVVPYRSSLINCTKCTYTNIFADGGRRLVSSAICHCP